MDETLDWMYFCTKHKNIVKSRILALQNIMRNIELLDELNYFEDRDTQFSDDFVETGFVKWKNAIETGDKYELLPQIPFEKAYRYKNPDFVNVSDENILYEVFGEKAEWKQNSSTVIHMLPEERQKIYKHFEYMFYYIINVKQELAYDIETSL